MLIAPSDPKSNDEIDQLFDNTDQLAVLKFYINQVQFTPLERCKEVHTRALKRWNEQNELSTELLVDAPSPFQVHWMVCGGNGSKT